MRKVVLLGAVFSLALLSGSCGGGNMLEGLADDSSTAACRVEASTNLDKGNYDAVINSSCADDMQKAAAYLGKAGYDPADVMNRLIEGSNANNTADFYLKTLVGQVDDKTLDYVNKAVEHYNRASRNADSQSLQEDAKFNKAIASAIKGLIVAKLTVASSLGDPDNLFECDLNRNRVPDDVDATACALAYTIGGSCASGISYTVTNITINGTSYKGMEIEIEKTSPSSPSSTCQTTYKKLLSSDGTKVITTAPNTCRDQNNNPWPCPVVVNGQPADMVETIGDAINDAYNDITDVIAGSNPDLKQSIEDLRTDICGADGTCTADDIKIYLSQIKTGQQ